MNTNTGIVGIIGCTKVQTTVKGCIVYGLDSDDVYINNVFRVGPDSGLLYADTCLNAGVYNFNVTADITNQQLHAVAKVVVKVKTKKRSQIDLKITNSDLKFPCVQTDVSNKLSTIEKVDPEELSEGGGDVNTNEILSSKHRKKWSNTRNGFYSRLLHSDVKESQEKGRPTSERERDTAFVHIATINSKHKRAVPPSVASTRPSVAVAPGISTVQSIKIFHESSIADTMMSSIVLLVISFGTMLFFGSIIYFGYKRLKKCGDYAIDEDAKFAKKQTETDETVYATVPSVAKNPNILGIEHLKQNRVVDSIEITKQKLSNGPASVFTIQRSYEEESANRKRTDDDEMFVMDMQQLSVGPGSEYSKILLKSNSASTPTITATLVDEKDNFPQSILSTSRRNSVSSKKDGGSLGSGDLSDNQSRRKSVTFSDIIELYQG